jgi:hypothetical protein
LKQNLQKPVLNSFIKHKHTPITSTKNLSKKPILLKQKSSALNLTNDDYNDDRKKLRLSDAFLDVDLKKLDINFKKNKPVTKIQDATFSDKGILIHSLSDLFMTINKMELEGKQANV